MEAGVPPNSSGALVSRRHNVLDALVISDIHLGSDTCEARPLTHFLERVRHGDLATRRLILNGDVFDSIDFRRLNKHHWRVLSMIRKLSDEVEAVWVNGNHDGPAEIVSHLLGVEVRDEAVVETGGRRVLVMHGHRFDEFIDRYPLTSRAADWLYRGLQRLDRSHAVARRAKRSSKTFLRCVKKVEEGAVGYARRRGFDVVCCGHTHVAAAIPGGAVGYFNSGCWTERPCHYLTIADGEVCLHQYRDEAESAESADPRLAAAGQ
jgi:UDP-2,3-diacylglucosamine pyrophosphatase LpxH